MTASLEPRPAGPGAAGHPPGTWVLPRTRAGWVAVLLPVVVPVAPMLGLGVGALVSLAIPDAIGVFMSGAVILMIAAAVGTVLVGWAVIIRGTDRTLLVWIITVAMTAIVLFFGIGEALGRH